MGIGELRALSLEADGARLFGGAVAPELAALVDVLDGVPVDGPGVRLHGVAGLRPFLALDGAIGAIAAGVLGERCRAVRAVLFDKVAGANWSVGWHQDRTICVERRLPAEGFGPWSVKGGLQHVAPPFAVLAGMVTLRVHLDDVPEENAPLIIAPGSHKAGRVAACHVAAVVQRCGTRLCLAEAGDVWLYATPILHASEAARAPGRRRVLQVDFAACGLPGGLAWLGV